MIGWNRLEFKDFFNEYLGDDIIHPDDFERFRTTLTSLGDECRECVFETRVLNMSGKVTVNEVRTRFLEKENDHALITLIFADITEQQRDDIISEISRHEVAVNVHFVPLPMLSYFRSKGYDIKDYPTAYNNYSHEISLPVYPQLDDEKVRFVAKTLIEAYQTVIER